MKNITAMRKITATEVRSIIKSGLHGADDTLYFT